jgi:phytoene synthase
VISGLLAPPPAEPDPLDHAGFLAARAICQRHARSFYFASHLLPVPKRYAAYAVYAFCRLMDDAVDREEDERTDSGTRPGSGAGGSGVAAAVACEAASGNASADRVVRLTSVLAQFLATLDAAYAGTLHLPARAADRTESQHALHAFALTVQRYRIPKQHFVDLADGCRMDLTITRYETWADLERYCYLVAGVVGLIMCPVFGLSDPAAGRQAVQMGNAMQLTNILRDVGEDWDRGRLYLPREDLDRFGYSEADVAGRVVDDRLRGLVRLEVDRARSLYRAGSAGLCHLANDGSRLTASAMAVVYSGILGAIERQGYDVFRSRAHLTTAQKFARVPRAWGLARRDPGDPLPDVFA